MWVETKLAGKTVWQVQPWQELSWLVHGFTTREWGNLGLHVGDVSSCLQNRRELSSALGFSLEQWVVGDQIHESNIALITTESRGRGATDYQSSVPASDGLVSREQDVLLASFYADCVPMLFLVRSQQIFGMAHGGWRGTRSQIAQKMVEKLTTQFAVETTEIEVAIGPSIGHCCYQVGNDVAAHFSDAVTESGDGIFLDLVKANELQLTTCGLLEENIYSARVCTFCHPEFFSYRREQDMAGRMAAFMGKRA